VYTCVEKFCGNRLKCLPCWLRYLKLSENRVFRRDIVKCRLSKLSGYVFGYAVYKV